MPRVRLALPATKPAALCATGARAIGIRRLGLILLLATGANAAALAQSQNLIDFEEFSGPSFFTGIQPPLTVGLATFSGGQILDAATFLPVNPTIVYGTAFFCPGCLPTLTIEFAEPVSDLSIFLMNGQTFIVTYFVEDDQGGMTQITLQPNFALGGRNRDAAVFRHTHGHDFGHRVRL